MKRFLVTEALQPGARILLPAEESRHALRVLRLGVGDKVLLANGRGMEAEGVILEAGKNGAVVEVREARASKPETRASRLELIQAPLKGPRMDWLVEKATELGVDALHLARSRYSVASGEKADRWQRLAQAAMKQSGRLRPPEICPAAGLEEICARFTASDALFLLSPGAAQGLAGSISTAAAARPPRVVLAIGPEGGFSPEEEALFLERGFRPCLLSPQILRGETAAIAAAAVALHALEFQV